MPGSVSSAHFCTVQQAVQATRSACELEPIRFPGAVPPHGALLVLDPQSAAIEAEQLNHVKESSQRLLGVLADILDISKLEGERLTLAPGDFPLGSVLDNIGTLFAAAAQAKGLDLHIRPAPAQDRMSVRGDAMRINQIVQNLVSNALKFTARGSIVVQSLLLEEAPGDVLVRFEVLDTGIGIAAENQKKIFAAFQQVDGSATRQYGGTGLGLAICKRLAKLVGGDIGVDSQVGVGSSFWFTARLPKCRLSGLPFPRRSTDPGMAQQVH